MPQPPEVTRAHDALLGRLRNSEARILDEMSRIRDDILAGHRLRRLDELLAVVRAEMEFVRTEYGTWQGETLPAVFDRGAIDTGLVVAGSETFAAINRQALDQLVTRSYSDILARTRFVEEDAKRWWRDAVRVQAETAIVEGMTAVQAGRALARAAPGAFGPDGPLNLRAVTYANGSVHSLTEYSAMVMRTTTALAYNEGSFGAFRVTGTQYVEIFDGADCGLRSHDDPEKANGKVYPLAVASQYPISHPNCRRAFGARLDVTSDEEAASATSLVDPASAADQARFERERATRQGGRRPPPRPAPPPRSPRTPRPSPTTAKRATTPRPRPARPEPIPPPRPGDRFRGTGDWREGLADDFDVIEGIDSRRLTLTTSRGRLRLPSSELTESLDAQRRIGATVNAEVERRFAPQRAKRIQLDELRVRRGRIESDRHAMTGDVQIVDTSYLRVTGRLVDDVEDAATDDFLELIGVNSRPGANGLRPVDVADLRRIRASRFPQVNEADFDAILDAGGDELAAVLEAWGDDLGARILDLKRQGTRIADEIKPLVAELVQSPSLADVRFEVLSEIRSFGGTLRRTLVNFPGGGDIVDEAIETALSRLPTAWIETLDASTGANGVNFVNVRPRAFARWATREINVGTSGMSGDPDILRHELMHLFEGADRTLSARSWGELTLRADANTGGTQATTWRTERQIADAERNGYLTEAAFPHEYTSRVYSHDAGPADASFEVATTGVEGYFGSDISQQTWFGHYGSAGYDTAFLDWIAGLLAAA